MLGLDISFSSNVRKALFMLVVINQDSVLHKFRGNQRSNRFLNPELILSGLAHNLMI
jgi:hypothetical protein